MLFIFSMILKVGNEVGIALHLCKKQAVLFYERLLLIKFSIMFPKNILDVSFSSS